MLKCDYTLSIFDYGYPAHKRMLEGTEPYNIKYKKKLEEPLNVKSIFDWDTLLDVALEKGDIDELQRESIDLWRDSPYNWNNNYVKTRKSG